MSALVLAALVRANLAASVAILLVLVLRRPARRRFGALAAYALWLVVPACAAASFLPAPTPTQALAPVTLLAGAAAKGTASLVRQAPDLGAILVAAWLAGAALMLGVLALRQARFLRTLGRLVPVEADPSMVRAERSGFGPAVIGALRPRIVLPGDFDQRFAGEARQVVLTHERVHLARGDAAINALAAGLRCLAWFNPLVHLAVRRMQVDQEIACDAAVVARHPHARRLYAETLLDTLLVSRSVPFGCHWPAAGVHPLKERVAMLQSNPVTPLRKALGAAMVGAVALVGAGAVWAANPAQPPARIVQPDWLQKPTGDDLARFYPAEAAKAELGGDAVLDCGVGLDGHLQNCAVRRESPQGAGFGKAALDLSPSFQMSPITLDGQPAAGGRVVIPIRFMVPKKP
jgi:TonB family protein